MSDYEMVTDSQEFEIKGEWLDGVAAPRAMTLGGRPIAIIDPENRAQVERLTQALIDAGATALVVAKSGQRADRTQAALREFANPTPPKPDEPANWLAVVEDREGTQWYRWSVRPSDRTKAWISVWDEDRQSPTPYTDIDVVRVVIEGVTP